MSQYAVVEFNQASQQPADECTLWDTLGLALEERDFLERTAKRIGRGETYRVYQLFEVDESEQYDWAVLHVDRPEPLKYTSEHAARRRVLGKDKLLRRRVDTNDPWEEVITS